MLRVPPQGFMSHKSLIDLKIWGGSPFAVVWFWVTLQSFHSCNRDHHFRHVINNYSAVSWTNSTHNFTFIMKPRVMLIFTYLIIPTLNQFLSFLWYVWRDNTIGIHHWTVLECQTLSCNEKKNHVKSSIDC